MSLLRSIFISDIHEDMMFICLNTWYGLACSLSFDEIISLMCGVANGTTDQ